jgi:hypothetical protein
MENFANISFNKLTIGDKTPAANIVLAIVGLTFSKRPTITNT